MKFRNRQLHPTDTCALTVTTAQCSPLRRHKGHQKGARDQQQADVATGARQKGILENGNRNEVEKGEKRVYRKSRTS